MKKIGMLKAIRLTSAYRKLSLDEREALRQERLKALVNYAKSKSPYFKNLYGDLKEDFTIQDLPVTNKSDMMQHFDDWVTDRDVHLSDILEFMKNLDNVGRKYKGKYLIFTTSGSTGNPSIVLYDKTAKNVLDAISIMRAYARKEDMKEFIKRGGKSAGVYATGGFYLSNSSIRNKQLMMPWKKKQIMVTSILNPMEKIVEELNRFQPAMLGGYTTALELLADEQKIGNLKISPMITMTGGEYLSDSTRSLLKDTFNCYVQTGYTCTEGGSVSCECRYQHFHINDDWTIMEPVDKDNRPVSEGELADKWLLTNLSNFTQPYIRYEITDRIILHKEGCACGNPSHWLEIEGRTDDILTFTAGSGKEMKIAPLALYAILKEVHEIKRFQLILHADNKLELRMVCENAEERKTAFEKARLAVSDYLKTNGIENISWQLSEKEPERNPISGKYKHIYKEI